jgi:MinD superfamily P-loop ATPase
MKELVVISGKGGTGKTSMMAAFASLAKSKVLCDADVDAADLHLIMDPAVCEKHEFQSGHTARIDRQKCTQCGRCRELCRWEAISADFEVDPIECEGCGVCVHFCPEEAIDFPLNTCGEWYVSETRFGPMVHARLGIAEENSGKLVTIVRRKGKELAEEKGLNLVLVDGAPGVGCPVIASIGGADAVLIVTEPTVSGKHDMERVVQLASFFKVPAMVCVNKYDLNPNTTSAIEDFARSHGLRSLGRIPFDPVFIRAMVQGQTLFEYNTGSEAGSAVRAVWENLGHELGL